MSRNFTADVDTQREYFNASYFNNSGENQIARYDTTLLKPFFPNPDQWKLAINRMRVPLSSIPLTKNNIPFQEWQVGIQYQKDKNGANLTKSFRYVPQFNPKFTLRYKYYNLADAGQLQLSLINPTSVLSTTQLSNTSYTVLPAFEKTNNNYTYYILNSSSSNVINAYQDGILVNSFTIGGAIVPSGQTFRNIETICTDASGNLYIGFVTNDNSIQSSYFYIQSWTRSGVATWALSTQYSIVNNPLDEFGMTASGLLAFSNQIIVYINRSNGTFYCTWTIGGPQDTGAGLEASSKWVSITNNTYIFRCSDAGQLTVSDTIQYYYTYNNIYCDRFLGFDNNGYLLLHRVDSNYIEIGYQAIDITTGNVMYTFTPSNGSYGLLYVASENDPIDSGPYDIFTYQDFLNQINLAFLEVFTNLKAVLGASFLPTEPPSIIYNAQTRLFSMVVEGQYLTTNVDGSNQYFVLMNTGLWNQFFFPSNNLTINSTLYKSLIIQNYGLNAVIGTGSATLPQFINMTQEDSTIYAFYDLVRIIVGTTRIPVSGDGEGRTFSNTGTASNSAVNMITDIVPDTSTLTPGSVIIYIPAGILRWYNLYAQQPFNKIDLTLQYETKDGSIYPIEIANGEFFSVKLEFKRGIGDF